MSYLQGKLHDDKCNDTTICILNTICISLKYRSTCMRNQKWRVKLPDKSDIVIKTSVLPISGIFSPGITLPRRWGRPRQRYNSGLHKNVHQHKFTYSRAPIPRYIDLDNRNFRISTYQLSTIQLVHRYQLIIVCV